MSYTVYRKYIKKICMTDFAYGLMEIYYLSNQTETENIAYNEVNVHKIFCNLKQCDFFVYFPVHNSCHTKVSRKKGIGHCICAFSTAASNITSTTTTDDDDNDSRENNCR